MRKLIKLWTIVLLVGVIGMIGGCGVSNEQEVKPTVITGVVHQATTGTGYKWPTISLMTCNKTFIGQFVMADGEVERMLLDYRLYIELTNRIEIACLVNEDGMEECSFSHMLPACE